MAKSKIKYFILQDGDEYSEFTSIEEAIKDLQIILENDPENIACYSLEKREKIGFEVKVGVILR